MIKELHRRAKRKLTHVKARIGPRASERVLVYYPVPDVGLGHLVLGILVYGALARRFGMRFLTTVNGTYFGRLGGDEVFFDRYLAVTQAAARTTSTNVSAISDYFDRTPRLPHRKIHIGRGRWRDKPVGGYTALAGTRVIYPAKNEARLTPDFLSPYDLIYVSSVNPTATLVRELSPMDLPLEIHPDRQAEARAAAGPTPYLAVHLRHGNGEKLGGRLQGDQETFRTYLENTARLARETARRHGLETIICLSDNADTAEDLAHATGGRTLGDKDLPDRPHLDLGGTDTAILASKVDRMFLDFAVLAGGNQIVAGESCFSLAAAVHGDPTRLQTIDRHGAISRPYAAP